MISSQEKLDPISGSILYSSAFVFGVWTLLALDIPNMPAGTLPPELATLALFIFLRICEKVSFHLPPIQHSWPYTEKMSKS